MKKSPAPEDVARRAYELFLSRGAEHGRDVDDWLEAEQELKVGRNASRQPASAPIRRWIK